MSQNFELLSQLEDELNFGRSMPKIAPDTVRTADRSRPVAASHELMNLAQTVFFSANGTAPHEVVLCGVDEDSGSSEICVQLGRILAARSSRAVCLVDADLNSSRLTSLLIAHRHTPISSTEPELCGQIEQNLWLAKSKLFDPTRSGVLAPTNVLKQSILELRKSFEYILIDAPGTNVGSAAAVLAEIADATILVIEANSTRKAAALRAKKTMQAMKVNLLGTVLNNRTFPIPEKIYHKL